MKTGPGTLWSLLATSTLVTLLVAVIFLGLEPRYRATVTLTRQPPEALARLDSASFIADFARKMPADWRSHPQFASESWWQPALGLSDPERIVARLDRGIWWESSGQFTVLGFESPSPRFAAEVLNLLAAHYLGSLPGDLSSLARAAEDVVQARSDLGNFRSRRPDRATLLAQIETFLKSMSEIESTLAELARDIDADRAMLYAVTESGDHSLMGDPVADEILVKLAALGQQRAGMQARYGDRHARMIALDREIQSATTSLASRVRTFGERIERETSRREHRMDVLRGRLKELDEKRVLMTSDLRELDRLVSLVSSGEHRFEAVGHLESSGSIDFIKAVVPERPVWPVWEHLLPGVFMGTMFVLALLMGIAAGIEHRLKMKK